jgi:hypothetical protein
MIAKANIKKAILSILLCGFGMWVVAGIWHNLILANLYEDTQATHEGIGLLLVAYFILASFMVYLYSLIYKGNKQIKKGLKFGMIIGLLWVFPHDLALAGAHEISITYAVKNGLVHMVEQGIGGIILAFVYKKF